MTRIACLNAVLGLLSARSTSVAWRPPIRKSAVSTLVVLALSFLLEAIFAPVLAQSPQKETDVHKALKSAATNVRQVVLDDELMQDVFGLKTSGKSQPNVIELSAPSIERVSETVASATYSKDGVDFVVTLEPIGSEEPAETENANLDGLQQLGTGTVRGLPIRIGMTVPDQSLEKVDAVAVTFSDGFRITVRGTADFAAKPSSNPEPQSNLKSNQPSPGASAGAITEGIGEGLGEGLGQAFAYLLVPGMTAGLAAEIRTALDGEASETVVSCPEHLSLSGTKFMLNPRAFTQTEIVEEENWHSLRCGYADPKYDETDIVDVEIELGWLAKDSTTTPLAASESENYCAPVLGPFPKVAKDTSDRSWILRHPTKSVHLKVALKSEHFSDLFEKKFDFLIERNAPPDHIKFFLDMVEIARVMFKRNGENLWHYPKVPEQDIDELVHKFLTLPENVVGCAPYYPTADDFAKCSAKADEAKAKGFPSGVVGLLAARHGEVRIRGCRGDIKGLKGAIVFLDDHILTGPKGRARVEFNDRNDDLKTGPSVMNVSPNSEARIVDMRPAYSTRIGKVLGKEPENFVELVYGAVRLLFKGGGGRTSSFDVKAGVAICGVRGSEGVIEYVPSEKRVSAYLNEGHMSVAGESGQATELTPGKYVVVERGTVGQPQSFAPAKWTSLVEQTQVPNGPGTQPGSPQTNVAQAEEPDKSEPGKLPDGSARAEADKPTAVDPTVQDDQSKGPSDTVAEKQVPAAAPSAPDGAPSNTAGPESETQVPPQSTVPDKNTDAELEFWRSVKDSKNPAEIEAYLSAFPNGAFVPLARIRLNKLRETGDAHRKDNAAAASSSGAKAGDPQTRSAPPVHDCDRLAAHPNDEERKSDGVGFGQISVDSAVRSCQRALADYPGTARFEYLLGRTLQQKESYGEALTHLRSAADKGYAAAMSNIGISYLSGEGVAKDEAEAARWFRKAVDKGNSVAMFNLGWLLENGQGVAKDEAEGVRWTRKAAEKGHRGAMYNLGVKYEQGRSVAKDEAEAVRWYRKAADEGHPGAMKNLGTLYLEGRGAAKDEAEAVRWYRKAADEGHPGAMYNIGWLFENGRGVAKDEVEAARWYRKAAEKGHANAMESLGLSYAMGWGVAKDEAEAVRLFRAAAEKGHPGAMYNLGVMYDQGRGVAKDEAEAARWYRKAAEKGHANAMNNLGFSYQFGQGVAKDEAEAARWYRKAAGKDHPGAMYNLGVYYENGVGVAQDPHAAAQLVFDALRLGHGLTLKQMTTNAKAWSKEFRRELQRLMQDAGVYDGAIDGSFGPGTRRAIEALNKQ